ncbi:hypothetical protein GCM10022268_30760 [Sphingomonas cynarae]|uniref:Uncharacterized protein n=1 Tax=Sphingomonas cynarae TaxID=930197 RepID=A0ABP7EKV8_9SPHN
MARFAAPHMSEPVRHKLAAMMPNFIMPLITRFPCFRARLGPKAAWGKAGKIALTERLLSVAEIGHMSVYVCARAERQFSGNKAVRTLTPTIGKHMIFGSRCQDNQSDTISPSVVSDKPSRIG